MTIACTDYNIYINSKESLIAFFDQQKYSRVLVLVDENTQLHCLPIIQKWLPGMDMDVITVLSGEINKNLASCNHIWHKMLEYGADRHSLCINLGGGVIGDMGGFCASTFMRGMDFIQVPTTLLSMVDASVGGKLGIDFEEHKNFIGLFNNPKAVFVFSQFIDTLPIDQIRSGFAEVVKHGLIQDVHYWDELNSIENFDTAHWENIIQQSIQIKKNVVEQDPREEGLRKLLNFGHTIGHAIESHLLKSQNPLLHGEAIALGMICESHISFQKDLLARKSYESIKAFIQRWYEDIMSINIDVESILQLCKKDKKNINQEYRFTLLNSIGKGSFDHSVSRSEIIISLKEIS